MEDNTLGDGQHFTRADWRRSRKRARIKRIKPWGGCKKAPAAFLAAAQLVKFKPGWTNRRICSATKRDGTPCGNLALSGLKVCGCHGGFSIWARRGILQKTGKKQAIQAQRAAAVEDRTESAPAALVQMQVYRDADRRNRMRLIRAYNTTAWMPLLKTLMQNDLSDTNLFV